MIYCTNSLIQVLGKHLVFSRSRDDFCRFTSVLLLETAADFDPDFLCIGSPEICEQVLSSSQSGYLLSAGDSPSLRFSIPDNNISVFITDLGILKLSNLINRFFQQYREISSLLSSVVPYTIKQLFLTASQITDGSFVLLDDQMNFLYDTISKENSSLVAPVLLDASDRIGSVCSFFGVPELPGKPVYQARNGYQFLLMPLPRTGAYLFSTGSLDSPVISMAVQKLSELCDPLLLEQEKITSGRDNSFQLLFSRIITDISNSDDSLMFMLKSLPNPPEKNLRLILIRPEGFPISEGDSSLYSLVEPVKTFFPGTNIAVMPEEIVVLLSSEIQYCPLEFEKMAFEKVLSDHHAIAMVGNPFTSITAMRVMYRQCRRMFPIALAVRLPDEIRCMTFARYTQYNVIDICAKSIQDILGGSDIVILCHPGVLTLTRYDRAYGSNLRDVMFHYLMNDRSIAKTSEKLFMHRNTTIYKIRKIEELIGESMDDPYLRHNLIFSCLLLRYRENYQKEGITLTTFEQPKRKKSSPRSVR